MQTVKPVLTVIMILLCWTLAGQASAASAKTEQAPAANAKHGSRIYNQYCISCHGAEGKGDGDRAKNEQLDPRPRVHANGTYMNMIPDMRFFRVIKYGGRTINFSQIMPQWQHILSDEDIVDVIAHIRTLADPPYEPGQVRGCMIPVPENERTGPIKQ